MQEFGVVLKLLLQRSEQPCWSRTLAHGGEPAGAVQLLPVHACNVREMDGAPLLASAEVSDNVLSILTRLSDQHRMVE